MTFEQYRQVCEQHETGVRKVGILDAQSYTRILNDPATITSTIENVSCPVLLPLRHGLSLGYDVERCERILDDVGASAGWIWAGLASASSAACSAAQQWASDHAGAGIFGSTTAIDASADLTATLLRLGVPTRTVTLRDRRASAERQTPSLSLYGIDLAPAQAGNPGRFAVDGMWAAYQQMNATDTSAASGTVARWGPDLTDADVDQLWTLYERRFQWLGEHHPISMEDSPEAFRHLITAPDMLCILHQQRGRVVAFTYFTDNLDNLYWLSPRYLRGIADEAQKPLLFFPGIVSDDSGLGYASVVLDLVIRLGALAGGELRVVFENTNLSETYVPTIVMRAFLRSGKYNAEPPTVLDRTFYSLSVVSDR